MSSIGTQCSTRSKLFPVEWPLTTTSGFASSQSVKKQVKKTNGIKKRKTRRHRRLEACQRVRVPATADQETQTEHACAVKHCEIEYNTRETSVGGTNDVIYEGESPSNEFTNIFESLNRDEATWLAEEVHQVNKKVFGTEQTAEELKKKDLDGKKASLNALQEFLKDLHRNIKYPDEETARDLDTLDEASNDFGVRNMVNYLSLLDGYFNELQGHLDEQ